MKDLEISQRDLDTLRRAKSIVKKKGYEFILEKRKHRRP